MRIHLSQMQSLSCLSAALFFGLLRNGNVLCQITTTLLIAPLDATAIDNIADGLSGFVDETQELQQWIMTTLLLDDGSRMWLPNSLSIAVTALGTSR